MSEPRPTSVLSDGTIRALVEAGRIAIRPWDPALVQPASVDLRLGDSFRVFHNHRTPAIDLRNPPTNLTEEVVASEHDGFVIHPGEFCLGRTLEYVELPDDIVARIEGKALATDTEVPTPGGWASMGTLRPGDLVFGADGRPTPVVAVSEALLGRECREVEFSDGTRIVADLDHRWVTRARSDRRRGRTRVVTTGEIERTLRVGGEPNHVVEQCRPIRHAPRELPVDPYALGVRLGGGTSATAPELAYAGRAGSRSNRLHHLRDIPPEYLLASIEQRRALLEGLMDTDGAIDVHGRCAIATIDRGLAEQCRELIASLGHAPVVAAKLATLDGDVCGIRHEVTFTPHEGVFRRPRKRARQSLCAASSAAARSSRCVRRRAERCGASRSPTRAGRSWSRAPSSPPTTARWGGSG